MPLTETQKRRWRTIVVMVLLVVWLTIAVVAAIRVLDLGRRMGIGDYVGLLVGATVLVTVVKSVIAWARRRRPPPGAPDPSKLARAREALADMVERRWTEEARIRSLGDPHPMPVIWHLTGRRALMDHPRLIAPDGPLTFQGNADDIAGLAGQFRGLRCRRLVITGGPGTGKTTLAVQLLLELVRTRAEHEPVPVLLSIAGWDASAHRRLHRWVAEQLALDYNALCAAEYGGDQAPAALAEGGHILPVLDGLDELPPDAQATVIRALNESLTDRDQVILTSRTSEYAAAVRAAGDVLTAAAVIAPTALTRSEAASYLEACLPPVPRHDWAPTLAALRSGAAPALGEVATTPLGLWLIRMVYVLPNADPAPLVGSLGTGPDRLRSYLLDHLVDALIRARPPTDAQTEAFRPRKAWDPERARIWLSHLATVLPPTHTRDLAWWHLARDTTSPGRRRLLQVTAGLAAGTVVGLLYAMWSRSLVVFLASWLVVWVVFAVRARGWFTEVPGFSGPRIRDLFRVSPRRLGLALAICAVSAVFYVSTMLMAALLQRDTSPWVYQVIVTVGVLGVTGGLALAFVTWFRLVERSTVLAATTTPGSTWRADRRLTLVRALAAGLMFALVFLLSICLLGVALGGPSPRPEVVLGAGFIGLVSGALIGAFVSGHHHAWLACSIILIHSPREHLPGRLIPFLEDMHRLGLLRTVGPLYQFRHAVLHDHLAAEATSPRRATPVDGRRRPPASHRYGVHLTR